MPIAVHMATVIAMMVTEETGQPIVILIPVMVSAAGLTPIVPMELAVVNMDIQRIQIQDVL